MSYKGLSSAQIFTYEQVKEINNEIKKNISGERDSASKTATKKGKFFNVPVQPLIDLTFPWLCQCQEANRKIYGYDAHWDFHLDSFSYNVYEKGDEYSWHIDINNDKSSPFDSKLTCLLNLSEKPYEGGEFKLLGFQTGLDEKIKFDCGYSIIFNSLIAHKVTPVTEGERITLTYFANGPAWR